MDSTQLLETFRTEVFDNAEPYLWSDVEIYRYIDGAQKMFCRLTEGLEDARTASVTKLVLTPGQEWAELSPLILKIRSARRDGRPLTIVPYEDTLEHGDHRHGVQGAPRALVLGETRGAVRVHPVPTEATTIDLAVFRLPLKNITDMGCQRLEVEDHHADGLLLWMKYMAYGKQDSEVFDPNRAAESELAFRTYCAKARQEQGRARHPTGATMYGGY